MDRPLVLARLREHHDRHQLGRAFADAYLRGVELPDALATYDAAVKNASTPSSNDNVGRKSLRTSTFLGYTPASQGESVSWATEGYINDYGIGNMAAALAEDPATPESRRATLREEAEYYLDRATNYVNMFDPAIEFFQARNADGTFATPADQYNPRRGGVRTPRRTAGTSRSTRRRTRRASRTSTAATRDSSRSSTSSSRPPRHHPARSTRRSRPATAASASGVSATR